ncbi:TlpA family protein disulfide reductase [bacterium]|nr:TlpA family protein disulfide reductase [bacterium]
MVENYGDSALARRFGVTRYPAIFVEDVLVAKPKDFGFYGKGEGSGEGRYTPWKDAKSHERYRTDLKRMIDLVLADKTEQLRKEKTEDQTEAAAIASLPQFALTDLSGKAITKADLADRIVLVEFWATWCPPCRGTLTWLGDLKKRYEDRLVVIAIAVESEETDVREIAKSLNIPLRWTMGTPEVARVFGDVTAVPTMFLFDSNGKTVAAYFGAPPDLHANAERVIKSSR